MSGKAADLVNRAATKSTARLLKVMDFILSFWSSCSSLAEMVMAGKWRNRNVKNLGDKVD